jgi:hypothetical protein
MIQEIPLIISLPDKFSNSASCCSYKGSLFSVNLFSCFFFASSSLFFFFPSTLPPHHKRLALYTTTLNDECRATLSFSPSCPSYSNHPNISPLSMETLGIFFRCTHFFHCKLRGHCIAKHHYSSVYSSLSTVMPLVSSPLLHSSWSWH